MKISPAAKPTPLRCEATVIPSIVEFLVVIYISKDSRGRLASAGLARCLGWVADLPSGSLPTTTSNTASHLEAPLTDKVQEPLIVARP